MFNKTFDLVFSNPPYNDNIDIKIMNEIIDIATEWVLIHPSIWLVDNKRNSHAYNRIRKHFNGHLVGARLFNGNPIFNIGLFNPVVITHVNMNHEGSADIDVFGNEFEVDDIYDVTMFGGSWLPLVKPFKEKIDSWTDDNSYVWSHRVPSTNIDEDKYYCQFSDIQGGADDRYDDVMYGAGFYTITLKDKASNIGIRKESMKNTYCFDTNEERNNFLDFFQTKFVRFCVATLKTNGHLESGELRAVPWLDFKEQWNDNKLFEYFNIDAETQDYILDFIPDFHKNS